MQIMGEKEIFLLIAVGVGMMIAFALAFIFYYAYSQRKLLLQEVESKNILLQRTIMAQEGERRRIAKDLHDEIGSKLNVLFLYFQHLRTLTKDPESYQSTQEDISNLLNTAIGSTRNIAHNLLPPTLEELGIRPAIIELATMYMKTGSIQLTTHFSPQELSIKNSVLELNVFRIIQELLHNSLQHGKANRVMIHFLLDTHQLIVTYEDDGVGFNTQSLGVHKGLGMRSIESRLHIIQGFWSFQSAPGKGFQVKLTIPLVS